MNEYFVKAIFLPSGSLLTAFPFIPDVREWGTVTESGDIGGRLKALQKGGEGGSEGVKTLVCLSPPSPHPSCCARACLALYL